MKHNFKMVMLMLLVCLVFSGAFGQAQNQAANPLCSGVTTSADPVPLNGGATLTFKLGNNGDDPIPAEKEEWTINLPFDLLDVSPGNFMPPAGTATTGLYEYSRTVSGTTLVIVLRDHQGMLANTIDAPQDEYLVTYSVTGKKIGGPAPVTINNAYVALQGSFVGNTVTTDDNADRTISVVATLPVQMLSFSGTATSCQANLNWSVAQETNFKNYIVEYSADGLNFSAVKTVNANGSNSSYSATHQAPAGKAYYRLKLVDIDGRFGYSKTIGLNISCGNGSIQVYPNPANDVVNVVIAAQPAAGKQIATLTDALGQTLVTQLLNTGSNRILVNKFPAGTYALSIEGNQGSEVHKIVIKR
ncbi:MAG: T9SS type A sorting domain-containing protein [Chitinophagaceae bacterium]